MTLAQLPLLTLNVFTINCQREHVNLLRFSDRGVESMQFSLLKIIIDVIKKIRCQYFWNIALTVPSLHILNGKRGYQIFYLRKTAPRKNTSSHGKVFVQLCNKNCTNMSGRSRVTELQFCAALSFNESKYYDLMSKCQLNIFLSFSSFNVCLLQLRHMFVFLFVHSMPMEMIQEECFFFLLYNNHVRFSCQSTLCHTDNKLVYSTYT